LIALIAALALTTDADVKIRVIYGSNKSTALDSKLNDLFGLLKNIYYTSYELKETTDLKLPIDGAAVKHDLPAGKHLLVAAKSHSQKKIQIDLEIPELKFKAKAQLQAGATLVVGGPKFEGGVLLFALTATQVQLPGSKPASQ